MDKAAVLQAKHEALIDLSQNTVYLMGGSFILGSLFTIFLLLVLDFMRAYKQEKVEKSS